MSNLRTGTAACVLAIVASSCGPETSPETAGTPRGSAARAVAVDPAAAERLRVLLCRFAMSDRQDRGRVVHEIRGDLESFRSPLLEILAIEDEETLVAAIAVSGWLRLQDATVPMYRLSRHARADVRASAIDAGHAMGIWSDDEVLRFLEDEDATALVAGLRAVEAITTYPMKRVLRLLEHGARTVRDAAVNSLIRDHSREDWARMRERIRKVPHSTRAILVEVLTKTTDPSESQATLHRLLEDSAWNSCAAALRAFATRGETIERVEPILEIAVDRGRTNSERASAWLALEKTGSAKTSWIREQLSTLPPETRVYAARCLVSRHEMTGVEELVDIRERYWNSKDEARARAATSANRVLIELAKGDYGPVAGGWPGWFDSLQSVPHRELPSPWAF